MFLLNLKCQKFKIIIREETSRENFLTIGLAADVVLFNSNFNRASFLENINKILKILPDHRPKDLRSRIERKSEVVYFPVEYPKVPLSDKPSTILHIVWPHRWEFDKGPEDFFGVLFKVKEQKIPFKVSILGECFTDNPLIFSTAKSVLKEEIVHFGYVESKSDYYDILGSAHVVVSTAKHEFFGVSVLEAVYCGCYPLAPNALAYPELYPNECLFSSLDDLYTKLRNFCVSPSAAVEARKNLYVDFDKYSSSNVVPNILKIINS